MIGEKKLAVIGLGYVGLPLACAFGKIYETIGFDISLKRCAQLQDGIDTTGEVTELELKDARKLHFSSNPSDLSQCTIFIVTVPTPINPDKSPNLQPIKLASKMIARHLKVGDIVIYESTVYPGLTEEICVPILEDVSGLKFNTDFYCGYSPERINPGDKKHNLRSIVKVTSGSTPKIAKLVDDLYGEVISAGTHLAPSIRVAEAAKIIENTQRDLNIALMNELSQIFRILDIDFEEVLLAARTKWNFLHFTPGLVGGHCIGVDPYYLTNKAQESGYEPKIILSGRKINDEMAKNVAYQTLKCMRRKEIDIAASRCLVLGITFKENCPDIRNTKVVDLVRELEDWGVVVDCYDPWADKNEVMSEYNIEMISQLSSHKYDTIVIAVPHEEFQRFNISDIRDMCKAQHVIVDVKWLFSKEEVDVRL